MVITPVENGTSQPDIQMRFFNDGVMKGYVGFDKGEFVVTGVTPTESTVEKLLMKRLELEEKKLDKQ